MKKSVTKVVKATVAFAMAIGAGVGTKLGNSKEMVKLNAAAGSTPSGTWIPIGSGSDVNTSDDFLLSYTSASGTYYGTGAVSSKALTVNSAISSAKTVQFVSTDGGYFLKISGTKYLNNSSGTDISQGDSGSSVWRINSSDLCVENTSNSNRFLGGASDGGNIKAYASGNKNSYPNVHVYKQVFSVTYTAGDGTGSDYVVNNVSKGSYTLISFANSGFTAPSGKRFKCWRISSTEYNAGASYTISGATTVTAVYEDIPSEPYINLTLNSGLTAFTGQTVSITAEYGNGVSGLTWTVPSGSVTGVTATNSGYSATISGSSGTLTIRATDTGSAIYDEISISVTKVTLSLNKTSTTIDVGGSETLIATHNANAVGGINWSSNNAKVTVDNGAIVVAADAIVGSTATITATSDVDDSVSETCVVTITIEHGRLQSDPLTVAEAIAIGTPLANNSETSKDYYIRGFVASTGTSGGRPYYWLANGSEAEGFEIYNPSFSAGLDSSDCKVGAELTIHCTIKRYTSIIETGSVKEIVDLTYADRPATAFSIDEDTAMVAVGDEITLSKSVTPVYTTDSISWTSSSNSIATVSNGVVSGVSAGEVTITGSVGGYTDTCTVIVALSSTFDLSTNSPISASATQLKWSVSNRVDMMLDKNTSSTDANNYYPGKAGQSYTSTRFYKNQLLTIIPDKTAVAYKAEFSATTSSYATKFAASNFTNATAAVSPSNDKLVVVTFTNGLNPLSVVVGDTCGFDSVKIYYKNATAAETIVRTETRSSLAYKYNTEPLAITAAAIRFGAMISETLWNSLNGAQTIQGYGTLLSTAAYVSANGGQLSALYNSVDGSNVKKFDHAVAVMPDEANDAQKGGLVGTYYIWNLFKNVALDALTTEYVCVAYIRTASGVVFFKQAVASVDGLADAMLASDEYDDASFSGSLKYLSELN